MESIEDILFKIGFKDEDISKYIKLNNVEKERMLISHRRKILDSIHQDEKKIDAIDYVRYNLKK